MGREDPRFLVVGHINKSHGTQGELLVWPLTDHPEGVYAPGVVLRLGDADSDEPDPDLPPLRIEAVAWRVSTATSWRRPVRNSHRAEIARPTAPSAAELVSPMRNVVGKIGSVSPVNWTASAFSSGQPAMGISLRSALLVMAGTSPLFVVERSFLH